MDPSTAAAAPGDARTAEDATRIVVRRIADMIRGLPDTGIAIPRSEWTVGEAGAHLAYTNIGMAMMARGFAIPHGDGTRAGLAEANDVSLEGFTERDGAELAARIVQAADAVVDEVAVQPAGRICPTPMGEVDPATLVSYLLMHNLMHGCAIASALGAPAPFEAHHLPLVWPFIHHILPRVIDRQAAHDLNACIELRVGDDFGVAMMFDDGELSVARAASRAPDCTLEAEPLAFFLMGAKLISPSEAVERGQARVTGSRPELGPAVMSFFEIP